MNVTELRELNGRELQEELLKVRKDQFNLRMQAAGGQLPQTHLLHDARREIARIKTVMSEQRLQGDKNDV